jgi:hypothetical protein
MVAWWSIMTVSLFLRAIHGCPPHRGETSPLVNGKPFCMVIATAGAGTTEYRSDVGGR